MKNLLFMLFAFTTLSLNAESVVEKTTKTISNTVDSVKVATVNSVNFVDTSSTFKTIYQDVKSGIMGLAQGLKVGAEHVYIVLVKQQVVIAVTWLVYLILCIPIIIYTVKFLKWCWEIDTPKNHYNDRFGSIIAIGCGIILIFFLLFVGISHLDKIVSGIINPEYGAIMEIINFVKK